jgi:hypothetical protein
VGLAGRCPTVSGGQAVNGSAIQLSTCNGGAAQRWTFDGAHLKGVGGYCLDVKNNVQANGTPVQLWQCNGGASQKWSHVGDTFRSAGGLCLRVKAGDFANGTPLVIRGCSGDESEKWSSYTVRAATDFGVACDGTTDDTAELQSALNALQPYQMLKIPGKTCVTSKHLSLSTKSHVGVVGAGMDATILKATDPADSAFVVQGGDTILVSNFQVHSPNTTVRGTTPITDCFAAIQAAKNLTFDSLKAVNCSGAGFLLVHANNVVIQNSVDDHSRADAFHVGYGSSNVIVRNNNAIHPGDDMFASIGYSAINKNVTFVDNEGTGGAWGGGVAFEATDGGYAARNHISTTGVSCFRAAAWGAWVSQPTTNIVIEDNYGENCVTLTNTGHASIMVFTNIADVTNITVRNNTIVDPASGAGLRAFASNGAVVQAAADGNAFFGLNKCFAIGSGATVSRSGNTLDGQPCQ